MSFVKITSIPQITLLPLCRRASYLTIVLCCFHFENVGDYAVNGNISNETCEKQFLGDAGAHQPERWQANEDPGQPEKQVQWIINTCKTSLRYSVVKGLDLSLLLP